MRVIRQLIRHFWERGALTPEAALYLLSQGFANEWDFPGLDIPWPDDNDDGATWVEEESVVDVDPWEEIEQTLVEREIQRRQRAGHIKGPELKPADLRRWLHEQFLLRESYLAEILALAQRLDRCVQWQDALARLRNTERDDFHRALAEQLHGERSSLGRLYRAVDPEPLHEWPANRAGRGQAVNEYRKLLALSDASKVGLLSTLRKYDEIHIVANMLEVHRRLLSAVRDLYHAQPRLLMHALTRDISEVLWWSLVLVFNAHRDGPPDACSYGLDYGPLTLPDDQSWRSAWACALIMEPMPVAKFLAACYGSSIEEGEACGRVLFCPVGWHVVDDD